MRRLHRLLLAIALAVIPAAAQVTFTAPSTPLSAGYQTVAYGPVAFTATGGTGPYTYAITGGAAPAGITLSSAGSLSGTATASGTVNFTVTATDSTVPTAQTGSQAFSLTINPAPTITTASLPATSVGGAYSQSLTTTPGTGALTFTITGALPVPLTINPSTGLISGTPATAGTYNFIVTVTDTAGATGSKALSILVNAAPSITTASPLPTGAQTIAYSAPVTASGGTGVLTISVPTPAQLPTGLTFSAGVLSGTPTGSGDFNITFRVTDSVGAFSETPLALTIVPQPVISNLTPSLAPAGVADVALTVTGTGFVASSVVRFGATALTTAFGSSTQLTATIPVALIATPGSFNITVNNQALVTSASSPFTVNGPSIASIAPTTATAGTPAFTLTVNGANFVNGSTYQSTIRWNGNALATTFVNTGQLTAQVPANLITAAGTAQITVANTPTAISSSSPFTITAPPVISSLTPSSISAGAPAFNLTVSGSGFVSTSSVQWAGTPLSTTFVSATQLTAAVPATLVVNPGSVNITVVNPGPVTSAPAIFTVGAAPSITAITSDMTIAAVVDQ
ncbi:MAG: putative Ig domain-containing protein, partial [Acidobacteriota bacterium]